MSCKVCNGGIVIFDGRVRACKCGLFETDADAVAAVEALVLALGTAYRAGETKEPESRSVADAADVICGDRDDRTCPGWFIDAEDDSVNVRPCVVCNPVPRSRSLHGAHAMDLYNKARNWSRALPVHAKHLAVEHTADGCKGCCGFDVEANGLKYGGLDQIQILVDGDCWDDMVSPFGSKTAAEVAQQLYAQRYKPCARPTGSAP